MKALQHTHLRRVVALRLVNRRRKRSRDVARRSERALARPQRALDHARDGAAREALVHGRLLHLGKQRGLVGAPQLLYLRGGQSVKEEVDLQRFAVQTASSARYSVACPPSRAAPAPCYATSQRTSVMCSVKAWLSLSCPAPAPAYVVTRPRFETRPSSSRSKLALSSARVVSVVCVVCNVEGRERGGAHVHSKDLVLGSVHQHWAP